MGAPRDSGIAGYLNAECRAGKVIAPIRQPSLELADVLAAWRLLKARLPADTYWSVTP